MVERGSKSVTTSFQPKVTLLDPRTLPAFPRPDVTNPRDVYSLISESRRHGNFVASLTVNPQVAGKLPPLQAETAEKQLRALQKGKPRYGSYPDLLRLRKEQEQELQDLAPVRRVSSLRDLNQLTDLDPKPTNKKLKPILRHKVSSSRTGKSLNKQDKQDRSANKQDRQENKHVLAGVKFGRKEVKVIKDDPLPPIEGNSVPTAAASGPAPVNKGLANPSSQEAALSTQKTDNGTHSALEAQGLSPIHENHVQASHNNPGHRRPGHDLSPDIFPRGLPVEVRKPATPTYDDYPEAYWELRSPTVQEPSDLKEDMIDRDRYRLQQISSLKLKAVPRELAASKLDSYRKWHQNMTQSATPTPRGVTATPSAAAPVNGVAAAPNGSAATSGAAAGNGSASGVHGAAKDNGKAQKEDGKAQKWNTAPHDFAPAATSISPSVHPGPLKRISYNNTISNSGNSKANGGAANGADPTNTLTEDELHKREQLKAAAMAAVEQNTGANGSAAKPVKPSVINLGMEHADLYSATPTSDLYNGVRRVVMTTRPYSDKAHSVKLSQGTGIRRHPGSALSSVTGSNCATVGSTYRVPSAPSAGTPQASSAIVNNNNDKTGKKILKKFNRLQVFSEKAAVNDGASELADDREALVTPPDKRAIYLPQCRPPTYKLDMRNYPPRPTGSGTREWVEEGGEHKLDGYPLLASDPRAVPSIIQSPDRSEATSLNFRFRNGEVIVSRQGKREHAA